MLATLSILTCVNILYNSSANCVGHVLKWLCTFLNFQIFHVSELWAISIKMVVQTKRKNPSEDNQIPKASAKKRKQDITWLTEGIAGTDPFDGKNISGLICLLDQKAVKFFC